MSLIEKVAGRLSSRGDVDKTRDAQSEDEPGRARRTTALDDDPGDSAQSANEPAPQETGSPVAAQEAPNPVPPAAPSAGPQRATLDLERLATDGYLTPHVHMGPLAEEFRRIKRPLLVGIASAIDDGDGAPGGSNLLLVTSAMPGEGKTFVSINLAMSMCSEIDTTVLLVDCDARRATLSSRLGLDADAPGLLDVLENRATLAEAILPTNVPKLSCLPAGRADRIDERFASAEMRELLSEISARYPDRVVILDSAPLMVASESAVLARLVGSIVMVVAADDTTEATVQTSLAMLEGFDNVSLLLNKASRTIGKDTSYYDYRP